MPKSQMAWGPFWTFIFHYYNSLFCSFKPRNSWYVYKKVSPTDVITQEILAILGERLKTGGKWQLKYFGHVHP